MAIRTLDLKKVEAKATNIYEAIVVMSKRARQINEETKIEFNQRIETLAQKPFDPDEEPDQPQLNPDQILIAKEFEARPKPTEDALAELEDDHLKHHYKEPEM